LDSIVTSELFEEDFYPAIHRNAFAAMKAMHERDATEESTLSRLPRRCGAQALTLKA
jgi:replicative DNA helicase